MNGEINTRLVTKPVGSIADAAAAMGELYIRGNIKESPMIMTPARAFCKFWLTIPEGFYSIVTAHDRFVGLWPAGCRVVRPWERVSHMVTKQYVVYDTPVKECPTLDNVMVVIDVSTVLFIKDSEEDVKNFVYKLGPERLDTMLRAFQEEAVRSMARQKRYSNIYDLMDTEELNHQGEGEGSSSDEKKDEFEVNEQLENTKKIMNQKLAAYGVEIYSITITNVHLPPEFRRQMEDATTFESKNIEQDAEQKFRMQVIQDDEMRNKANQRLQEIKEEHNSNNQQMMANEQKITDTYLAETRRIVSAIEKKMAADTLRIKTNSDLKEARLRKQKEADLERIAAEATSEALKIESELKAHVALLRADAKKEVARNEAQTLALKAQAENLAATKLKSKREFEEKMAHLRILKNLAHNRKLTLSGSNSDNPVAQMLASQQAGAVMGLNVQN